MDANELAVLKQLEDLAHALYGAIESGDQPRILSAQQALSASAEKVWLHYDQEHAASHEKALVHLLADMAIKELPQRIQDPANYSRIQHDLRLLKNSLVLLRPTDS